MTNREKFREVFNKDIHWSRALEPQILALKSAHIDGIDCMEEWLNSEYIEHKHKESENIEAVEYEPILDKIRAEIEASKWTDKDIRIERNALASGLDKALEIIDKYKAESEDKE